MRQHKRMTYFDLASKRAKELNKPLIVVGDPYNGVGSRRWNKIMKPYGCGDVCIDLTGCPKCKNGIKTDLLSYLKTLKDNSVVLFISCVLEYVDDIDVIKKEIERVSGSNNNVFIVSVQRYTLTAYIYTDGKDYSKNIIKGPPEYPNISYIKI